MYIIYLQFPYCWVLSMNMYLDIYFIAGEAGQQEADSSQTSGLNPCFQGLYIGSP